MVDPTSSPDDLVPVHELPVLPRRAYDAHKGTFGVVQVVAGSRGMAGAAVLAGRAALRSGAGLVRVACPVSVQDVVAAGYPGYTTWGIRHQPDGSLAPDATEELIRSCRDGGVDAVAVGPGLGQGNDITALVRAWLTSLADRPLVLDADGLNAVAPITEDFTTRAAPLVLTPHPGEFARLAGTMVSRVQADRVGTAVSFARRTGVVLVLKGANTLVTDGRRLYRNTTGNPGMATGGSGDVLTGIIAALIGQGMVAFDAAVLGTWIHGRAGDLAAARLGQTALTASDLIEYLPAAFREREAAR